MAGETKDDHLETVTHSVTKDDRCPSRAEATLLTIVAHPDPRRAGERAVLADLGRGAELSRRVPLFAPPSGVSQRPLADPHLSRQPVLLEGGARGLVVDTSETKIRLAVNGETVRGHHELSAEELRAGAVLLLDERIVLVLRHGAAFEPVEARLALYGWPGNVHELDNAARQLALVDRGRDRMEPVSKVEWMLAEKRPERATRGSRTLNEVSKAELRAALDEHGHVKKHAAEALGIHRASLYKLMRRFGMG